MNKAVALPNNAVRQSVSRLGARPYILAVFLSAALVFLVQPMFAKMATPLLGGAPNVWNVSLVCFQAALLFGYVYAHLLNHFVKSLRTQIGIHAALLIAAGMVLPFQLSGALGSPDPAQPTLWLIGVFALSIAPPFAIIAATAPLIQSWYSRSGRADAHDPYHLYGASNIGSLIGLVAYPLLLEPLFPIASQALSWSIGYGLLAALLIGSGLVALATGGGRSAAVAEPVVTDAPAAPKHLWQQRIWWLACAFVPSSLLVGVTTYISTDVASAPFLWVLPLILYISSFIIVFSKSPSIGLAQVNRLMPYGVAIAAMSLSFVFHAPLFVSLAIHLLVLFLAAMLGHGAMAADRPNASRLTEFYLIMSLGGVLGGAFNALLAPVLFDSVIEYPLMLLAILALRPGLRWMGEGRTRLWSAAAVASFAAVFVYDALMGEQEVATFTLRVLTVVALLAIIMSAKSRLGPIISTAAVFGISALANPFSAGSFERGFFGVVQVHELGDFRVMKHGTTQHGAQFLSADKALIPTTYYAENTPIGQAFSRHDRPGQIGVVGLGTGSVACYIEPGQTYTYYEIDPLVAQLAQDQRYFTYLSECTPDAQIVLGDGRQTLAQEPAATFDLLLIDAFSSDSIPTHLLTVEAVDLYLSRLSEDGTLVMHISNRHLELSSIVARIADRLNVTAFYQPYRPKATEDIGFAESASEVVIITRDEATLNQYASDPNWEQLESDGKRPWTDDYSNVIGAIIARRH